MLEWKFISKNLWVIEIEGYSLTLCQEREAMRAYCSSLNFEFLFQYSDLDSAKQAALKRFSEFIEPKRIELRKLGKQISEMLKI